MVEDNELNAEIVVELLKSEGASCDVAENGQPVVDGSQRFSLPLLRLTAKLF